MPKVLIADTIDPGAIDVFQTSGIETDIKTGLKKSELIAVIGEYDGLVVRSGCNPDADIIAAARRLKVIGRAGIGVDNIDIKAATMKGVVVMNTPFGNAITTAEHTIAMIFAAARQIPAANNGTQAGDWPKKAFMGVELSKKTLGLIGCGNIGTHVAERGRGLNMNILVFDPFLSDDRAAQIGVEKAPQLDALLARADIISLHTPLTDQTRNILSRTALAKTRKGVIVVNCARGGLIDEDALAEGLQSGHIAAAALDVFASEPARQNVLFTAPNFIATPHLGAATHEAQETVALQIAKQMSDYLLTGTVTHALNMPAITANEAPQLAPFTALAEKLGLFAGQISDHGFGEIIIDYEGTLCALNRKPVTAAAMAGLLRASRGDVNMVSAPALLAESGVKLSETKTSNSPIYDNLIRIRVKTKPAQGDEGRAGWRSLAGAVIAGQPRIVEVKNMALESDFHPVILYINNADRPGFIGMLGTLLGEEMINIATFHLGRAQAGGEAIALIAVDSEPSPGLMKRLGAMDHVRYAKVLKF